MHPREHVHSHFVVGQEAWKSLIIGKTMYAVGVLVWNKEERLRDEVWRVESCVRNGVIHGETAWDSFWEREAKVKTSFVCRILEEDGLVAWVGRGCGEVTGMKSRWWKEMMHSWERNCVICGWYAGRVWEDQA